MHISAEDSRATKAVGANGEKFDVKVGKNPDGQDFFLTTDIHSGKQFQVRAGDTNGIAAGLTNLDMDHSPTRALGLSMFQTLTSGQMKKEFSNYPDSTKAALLKAIDEAKPKKKEEPKK
jgi:hypothetical protein